MQKNGLQKTNWLLNVVSLIVVGAIVYFFVGKTRELWPQIREFALTPDWRYFYLGLILNIAALANWSYLWKLVLATLHIHASFPRVFLSFSAAVLGKYIPGKIWGVVIRFRVKPTDDISKTDIVLSSVLEAALITSSGFMVGLIPILRHFASNQLLLLASIIVGVLAVVCLHPKIFYLVFNTLLKKLGKPTFSHGDKASYGKLLGLLLFSLVAWFWAGLGFFIFLNAFYTIPWAHYVDIVGIAGLSFAVGNVAFFAPGGFGVREGMWLLMLSTFVPESAAVFLALMSRALTVIDEPLTLGTAWILNKVSR